MEKEELPPPREVWHVGRDAIERLAELGLTEEDLRKPLDLAREDALLCTKLDAPATPGFLFWSRANRYFREQQTLVGWGATNVSSILRAIAPEKDFAITALSGAGDVGVPHGKVRTKTPKGTEMTKLVRYNYSVRGGPQNNDTLYGLELPFSVFEPDMMLTWILLYKWTSEGIMMELSLPSDVYGKFVNRWLEHIIVTPIGFDDGGRSMPFDPDVFNDPDGGVDVPVERIA